MHFYWRVIEELKYLGETWTMRDPCLLRNFHVWVERRRTAIAVSEEGRGTRRSPLFRYKGTLLSDN
jgi:hypothetical protein